MEFTSVACMCSQHDKCHTQNVSANLYYNGLMTLTKTNDDDTPHRHHPDRNGMLVSFNIYINFTATDISHWEEEEKNLFP